jgi:topoisomerase IA-like protein
MKEGTTMASVTAERATEVVKEAEDIVAAAAKSDAKETVSSATTERGEARAWDAKAQID